MPKFTFDEVKSWVGSDTTRDELIDMVMEIANGIYRVEQLKQDINDYKGE